MKRSSAERGRVRGMLSGRALRSYLERYARVARNRADAAVIFSSGLFGRTHETERLSFEIALHRAKLIARTPLDPGGFG